jgi:N,N'-diacetyllegionaminate synthase
MSVKIIAEIGVNHNGSTEQARRLIDAAQKCGADMAKFQTFSAERLAARTTPKVPYQLRTSNPQESHYEMLRKLELSCEAHIELKKYCENVGIEFCSTPYSREDAIFLHQIGLRVFKVASADIVDRPLHEFIAGAGCACILATGMATLNEIEEALHIYDQFRNLGKVTLLQCTSAYPANPEDANLQVMQTLAKTFRCKVGYSDHTPGNECAIAAAALGATVIEKHFTLDKNLPGPDHAASSTPEEFSALVKAVRLVEKALGDGIKRVGDSEKDMRLVSRKSIVAAKNISAGHRLQFEDLAFQRPGTGLSPMNYKDLIGKSLLRDMPMGTQLQLEDFCQT